LAYDFGTELRENGIAKGLTQKDLAAATGLNVRAIRDLESGRTRRPRRHSIALLKSAVGLDLEWRLTLKTPICGLTLRGWPCHTGLEGSAVFGENLNLIGLG
jgi:transcriptional regulator with XRE-family HTH domain